MFKQILLHEKLSICLVKVIYIFEDGSNYQLLEVACKFSFASRIRKSIVYLSYYLYRRAFCPRVQINRKLWISFVVFLNVVSIFQFFWNQKRKNPKKASTSLQDTLSTDEFLRYFRGWQEPPWTIQPNAINWRHSRRSLISFTLPTLVSLLYNSLIDTSNKWDS